MPTSAPKLGLFPTTYLAGAAIVRGRAVMRGASVNYVIQATANAEALGIAEDHQATAERPLRVTDRPGETTFAEAGAAFAIDILLTSDADGRLVTATTTQKVHAIARQAAGATGDLVAVEIAPRGRLAP